jgi:pimeloyl-ACP methyl ester carboxylesterase
VDDAREHGEELFAELGHIALPTLIVRGDRSSLRPEQVAEIASALPDAGVERWSEQGTS